jgi:hypothetical protein
MKILFRACLFFALEVLLTVKAYYYSGYYLSDSLTMAASWLFPLIATLLALFLGWFFTMVIQHSKKIRSFYLLGLNTGFAIYFVLFCYFMFQFMKFNRRYGYNPGNQEMMRGYDDFRHPAVSAGFELLQSKFLYPRNLRLKAFFVQFRDTVIAGRADSITTVYFTYRLDGEDQKRFSGISVAAGKPVMLEFNIRTDTSAEYVRIRYAMEKDRQKNLDWLKAEIKGLPDDSISRVLKKAIERQ